jgi:hypothetical protein
MLLRNSGTGFRSAWFGTAAWRQAPSSRRYFLIPYGHFARDAAKREAKKLEGAFNV